MKNALYYGDNLDVLRNHIPDETVDLCYIDPPFNSRRDYNQIYHNARVQERAHARAFVDTWVWDGHAIEGFEQIVTNDEGRFSEPIIELVKGLRNVLKEGSLLAYLVSLTLRIVEIQRVLKRTGTFYLHCDPHASHYLKLVLDAVFCSQGGEFRNEIIWAYESGGRSKKDFGNKHDVIFRYTKSSACVFNADAILVPRAEARHNHMKRDVDRDGRVFYSIKSAGKIYKYYADHGVIPSDVWTEFSHLQQKDPERVGYPTQKPESLLERIIRASSNVGDLVLDAYCGCGTTSVVAEKEKRRWIGIDITYQSISLVLKRVEKRFGQSALGDIMLNGIPRDMKSAVALAQKKDDRLRKEFEKWAVLTYTNNRAILSDRAGAEQGIDGVAHFVAGKNETAKLVLQVRTGHPKRSDIATLHEIRERERAEIAVLITLEKPSRAVFEEARSAGCYQHQPMRRDYDRIQIVTIEEILKHDKKLDLPLSFDHHKLSNGERLLRGVRENLAGG
jgi:site-specific DNA-methyltransferase (adenine-specific)